MNKRKESVTYIISDILAAAIAWTLFYFYRRWMLEPAKYGYSVDVFHVDAQYFYAILLIPAFWVFVFGILGTYHNVYRKSRVRELGYTLTITFLGSVALFFLLLLDDEIGSYSAYRTSFLVLFALQFLFIYGFRFVLLSRLKYKLKHRIIGFNTLLVGGNQKAHRLYADVEKERFSQGYKFIGFLTIDDEPDAYLAGHLPNLGSYKAIPDIVEQHRVEEVILAVESSEHQRISEVLNMLRGCPVIVKAIPDMYDIITGSVKMNYIFGAPLIEITHEVMPAWQSNLKRLIDIVFSLMVLIVGFPFYLLVALIVKMSSKGPIFYEQERIGLNGKPFMIIKFRTMYTDAEQRGPQLSSKDDPRITPFGRVLRRYRIDEFPQFYNVLRGDMSLVGPRPERQFFIDQIVKLAPHYTHLHRVRPGITSWGQIKYGYAENVEQMIDRMKYDILYIENLSLAMDFKIIVYTVLIMLQGRGK
jgi:exopolysaccharide biosynthesis polyprenyl glycosylphosphotransferase